MHRAYQATWVVLLTGYCLLLVIVYNGWWQQPIWRLALRIVPVPYARVGLHPIWLNVILEEIDTQQSLSREQGQTAPTNSSVIKLVLRRAVANDFAWSGGLWVSTDEAKLSAINLAPSHDFATVQRTSTSFWHLSWNDYMRRIYKPYLLKQKLLTTLKIDPVLGHDFSENSDINALDTYFDNAWASNLQVIGKE